MANQNWSSGYGLLTSPIEKRIICSLCWGLLAVVDLQNAWWFTTVNFRTSAAFANLPVLVQISNNLANHCPFVVAVAVWQRSAFANFNLSQPVAVVVCVQFQNNDLRIHLTHRSLSHTSQLAGSTRGQELPASTHRHRAVAAVPVAPSVPGWPGGGQPARRSSPLGHWRTGTPPSAPVPGSPAGPS